MIAWLAGPTLMGIWSPTCPVNCRACRSLLPVDADDIESAACHQEDGVAGLADKPQQRRPAQFGRERAGIHSPGGLAAKPKTWLMAFYGSRGKMK
jgi:hypothetical protein